MSTRRFLGASIFAIAVFLSLEFGGLRALAAEPKHDGKTATEWIKDYTLGMTKEELVKSGGVQKWDGESLQREKKTREKAKLALKEMGPDAVPFVVSWIRSADQLAYRSRTQKGKVPGELEKPLPSWVSAYEVEWRSLEALKVFGPEGRKAFPVVMELLYSTNSFVAVMACETFGSMEASAEPALAALGQKLSDQDKHIRASAASAIGRIISQSQSKGEQKLVLEQLTKALKDEFEPVRWNATSALGSFESEGEAAVMPLIESLKAGNERAASALGQIGPVAEAAVPLLSQLATGQDTYLRSFAADALKRINLAGLKGKPADIYDKNAQGKLQIDRALVVAKNEGKHVLLQFGANWCGWCHRLHQLFKTDAGVVEELKRGYVVVLIDAGNKLNTEIDARYGHPTRHGLPVIVILDTNGNQLATQDTGKLESGDHHDPEKVKAFLKEWAPKR